METTLKYLFLFAVLLIVGSFVALVIYDLVEFRPYRHDIDAMLQDSHPLHKHPPEILSYLIDLSEGRDGIKFFVARRLLAKFEHTRHRALWWHITDGLWTFLVSIHYSDQDILTLWLDFAPYKGGLGLNASANWHYGRDLDRLSTEEIARIVTIARSPSLYERDQERLEKRARTLLDRIGGRALNQPSRF
jgi:hypothetical protein